MAKKMAAIDELVKFGTLFPAGPEKFVAAVGLQASKLQPGKGVYGFKGRNAEGNEVVFAQTLRVAPRETNLAKNGWHWALLAHIDSDNAHPGPLGQWKRRKVQQPSSAPVAPPAEPETLALDAPAKKSRSGGSKSRAKGKKAAAPAVEEAPDMGPLPRMEPPAADDPNEQIPF